MRLPSIRQQYSRRRSFAVVALLGLIVWAVSSNTAAGAMLGVRSMPMSSSFAGATANYNLRFTLSTPGPLGSVLVQFCNNTPEVNDPCTAPNGLDVSGVSLTQQTGATGFSIASGTNANTIVISRPVAVASAAVPVSYEFSGAINPANNGSYYTRIQTFATTNASGPASDYGSIAFAINNNLSISAEVPPFLVFCAGLTIPQLNCSSVEGDYINFGELSWQRPSSGTSQVLAATNAKDGYNVTVAGTTLTSGNNTIDQIITADVSRPGTGQFGFNFRANSSPSSGDEPDGPGVGAPTAGYGAANFYQFNPGDRVLSSSKPDDARRYTASYLVNVPRNQASGVYVSTLTYICLGNF